MGKGGMLGDPVDFFNFADGVGGMQGLPVHLPPTPPWLCGLEKFFFDFKVPPPFTPHLPDTQLNASLDVPTATDGNGHALFGSGNPATGWQVQETGHIETGSHVHYRTGDTILPDAVKQGGTLVFHGPSGPQVVDPAHNVSAANANRGAVSFDWSFDTGANGPGGQTLQQYLASGGSLQIRIDLDPTQGVHNLTLDARYDPVHNPNGSHIVWVDHDNSWAAQGLHQGDIIVADDAGNAFATQNSTNPLGFYAALVDHNGNVPGIQGGAIAPAGTYDFEVLTRNSHGQVTTDVHDQLILV